MRAPWCIATKVAEVDIVDLGGRITTNTPHDRAVGSIIAAFLWVDLASIFVSMDSVSGGFSNLIYSSKGY